MNKLFNTYKNYLISIAIGAALGFAYYYFIGCKSGTCAITSSPINSTLYGGFMGALLAGAFKKQENKTTNN